jgi:hypothetical protein
MQFHQLTIFAAPLFLYPGLSRRSISLLAKGFVASVSAAAIFLLYRDWISSNYPQQRERMYLDLPEKGTGLEVLGTFGLWAILAIIATVIIGVLIAWRRARYLPTFYVSLVPFALILVGLLTICLVQYHMAVLLILAGVVVWARGNRIGSKWIIALLAIAFSTATAQLLYLHSTGLFPGRQIIGAVVGQPSVWPILRFGEFSFAATAVYMVFLINALYRCYNRHRVATHVLFFLLAVWTPLIAIGLLSWYVPPRYIFGPLPFFLLCVCAGAFSLSSLRLQENPRRGFYWIPAAAAVLIINPISFASVVNSGYERHPDHKGAAEFILGADPGRESLLIAEDVLQQTYYLGQVDYRLLSLEPATKHAVLDSGNLVDQYTSTPIITSGQQLWQVLEQNKPRTAYIIGSGENFSDKGPRVGQRGNGIQEALDSDKLEIVYEGRDGKTQVWRFRSFQQSQ